MSKNIFENFPTTIALAKFILMYAHTLYNLHVLNTCVFVTDEDDNDALPPTTNSTHPESSAAAQDSSLHTDFSHTHQVSHVHSTAPAAESKTTTKPPKK